MNSIENRIINHSKLWHCLVGSSFGGILWGDSLRSCMVLTLFELVANPTTKITARGPSLPVGFEALNHWRTSLKFACRRPKSSVRVWSWSSPMASGSFAGHWCRWRKVEQKKLSLSPKSFGWTSGTSEIIFPSSCKGLRYQFGCMGKQRTRPQLALGCSFLHNLAGSCLGAP